MICSDTKCRMKQSSSSWRYVTLNNAHYPPPSLYQGFQAVKEETVAVHDATDDRLPVVFSFTDCEFSDRRDDGMNEFVDFNQCPN